MATSTAKKKAPAKATAKTAKAKATTDPKTKKEVITKYAVHPKDTGSSRVQVAILTERINQLSEHLESHPKDDHSRRGLLGLVGKRRKHLNYLRLHNPQDYQTILGELNLRK